MYDCSYYSPDGSSYHVGLVRHETKAAPLHDDKIKNYEHLYYTVFTTREDICNLKRGVQQDPSFTVWHYIFKLCSRIITVPLIRILSGSVIQSYVPPIPIRKKYLQRWNTDTDGLLPISCR